MTLSIIPTDEMLRSGVRLIETLSWREQPPHLHTLMLAPLANGEPVGPFMSIARFRLEDRVFPPHPHAGFSAITYMLEHSETPMRNRDSLGDVSVIAPGGSHWSIANAGMMHEETPENDGQVVDGFQIFLNHPAALKHRPPGSAHFAPTDFPTADLALGARAKVVIGSYAGVASPAPMPTPAILLQIDLERDARQTVESQIGGVYGLFVERGAVIVALSEAAFELGSSGYIVFDGGSLVELTATADAQLFLFGGLPIDEPIAVGGPFIMNDEEELANAFARFRSGQMGSLAPRSA
jgi:redox-sensitive bicupin YhaK (pirin superfamily)